MSLGTVRTMHAMSNYNVLKDDLAGFVFGILASPKLKSQPEETNFVMAISANGGEPVPTKIGLVSASPSELALTDIPQDRDRVLTLFKLSDKSKAKVLEQQALMRDMKARGTKGSFSIGVEPDFCKIGPIDPAREKFSVFIAPGGKGALMPLIENMSVKDLLKKVNRTEVRDC